MKRNRINKHTYRQPKSPTNAGEGLLIVLERYIGLDIVLMLLGLINESHGMRGYPLAWAGRGIIGVKEFFISLAASTLLIFVGDILTRIVIRISEPVTDVQRTLEKYSTPYTEYEDPYISEVKHNYEDRIAADYKKIRKSIEGVFDEEEAPEKVRVHKTIQVKKLLNGKDAGAEEGRSGSKSTGIGISIVIGVISIVIALFGIFDSTDSGYDWDDDLGENIVISDTVDDDDYYSVTIEGTAFRDESQDILDAINDVRIDRSLDTLEWNSEEDYYLTERAAELSIRYSTIRPCGEEGTEDIIGFAENADDFIKDVLADEDYYDKLTSVDIASVGSGIFRSDNGTTYYALRLYDSTGDSYIYEGNDEGLFILTVKDEYMSYETQLLGDNFKPVSADELNESWEYYYRIYAVNSAGDNKEELKEVYSWSDDTDIADIDYTGRLYAYMEGETDITVKPAENSGVAFTTHITVN